MHDNPLQADSSASSGGPLRLWNELHVTWGLSGHESPGERAQTLAARLSQQRFLLDESSEAGWPMVAAGDLLAALRDARGSWRDESLQQALAVAVGEFAGQYFTLPPAERRARWVALRHAADFAPELHQRLNHLATGLDVDVAALQDRDVRVQTLLDELRTTYPLPAAERTARRAALAREKRKRSKEWANLAQQALRRVESLPDLGRDYLSRLERAPARSKLIERHRRLAKHTGYVHSPPMGKGHFGVFVFFAMLMAAIAQVASPPRRPHPKAYPSLPAHYRLPDVSSREGVSPPRYDPEQARLANAIDARGVAGVLPHRDLAGFQRQQPLIPARIIPANDATKAKAFALFIRQGYVVPKAVGVLEAVGGIYLLLHDADFDALQEWLESHPHLNLRMLKTP